MNNSAKPKGHRVKKFVTQDVWDMDPRGMPALKAAGVKFLRAVYLIIKGFREDECPLHASALTLSSLMAIVWRFVSYYPYLFIGAVILPGWIRKSFKRRHAPKRSEIQKEKA